MLYKMKTFSEYREDSSFDVTTINLSSEYNKLNKLIFSNEVEKIPMSFATLSRKLGQTQILNLTGIEKPVGLKMSNNFTSLESFINVLAHEMIHILIAQRNLKHFLDTKEILPKEKHHGKSFNVEMKRINRMNNGITITSHYKGEDR